MDRFEECLAFVLKAEGGYIKNSADPGGATNKGVTQATYDAFRRQVGMLPQPVMLITDAEVSKIYLSDYWGKARCGALPPPVDLIIFDAAVNSGCRQAVTFLQRAVGVDTDGAIGPVTLDALSAGVSRGGLDVLVSGLIAQRRSYYQQIVMNKPGFQVFLKGWLNRLTALEKEIGKWTGNS